MDGLKEQQNILASQFRHRKLLYALKNRCTEKRVRRLVKNLAENHYRQRLGLKAFDSFRANTSIEQMVAHFNVKVDNRRKFEAFQLLKMAVRKCQSMRHALMYMVE